MEISVVEQIKKFQDFIDSNYYNSLLENVRKGDRFLLLDFAELSKYDPDLATQLLDAPEDTIKAIEKSLEQFDIDGLGNFNIRFHNMPPSQHVNIRDIRSNHISKLVYIEGLIRQKSDVRPQVTSARFECPVCGNIMNVLQLEGTFKEPTRCGCGRKGKFVMLDKEMVDAQGIVLEEASENLEGGEQPKRINVLLTDDLVSPLSEKRTSPGSKVQVIGVVKEVPLISKTGAKSTRFDLMIDANYVKPTQDTFYQVKISDEEEKQILEIANDPKGYDKLVNSMAPSIYGYEKIKEALLLQLMGGVRKVRMDKVVSRGDMHILLVGDPGAGKSALLKRITTIAPKGRYVSGKGVSLHYDEPLLIKEDEQIKIVRIGEFVNQYSNGMENIFVSLKKEIKALSLSLVNKKLEWKGISHVFRHRIDEKLLKFELESGREITVTKDHSIYAIENGKLTVKKSQELTTNDYVLIPKTLPVEENDLPDEDYAKFLGYFIAEGHLHSKQGEYYKIEFTLGKKDTEIIEDLRRIAKEKFNKEIRITGHGANALRVVINGKKAYDRIVELLGDTAHKKAKEKKVPEIILNSNKGIRTAFIDAYLKGDAGVTKSKELASNLAYLFLQDSKITSFTKRYCHQKSFINGREINNVGWVYELKSPKVNKKFDDRYSRPPFAKFGKTLSKYFFKRMKSGKYRRVSISSISNNMLLQRFNYVARNCLSSGKSLKELFGNSILEYLGEHNSLFQKYKAGRQMLVSTTIEGEQLIDELIDFYSILNSDLGFVRIKQIQEVENNYDYVYDISIPENENFVAGFGGVICHNSGAGITAAVVRDEFLHGWALEAGAMVLSSDGLVCVDELDKMSNEDRSAMHEALENQTVSISKANIQATLIARTTVLAAANPKFGRFDPYTIIADQIDLPPTLINRFDLIFPIKDLPEETRDEKMAKHMLALHQNPDVNEPEIPTDLLRKYIAYARQRVNPKLTDGALEEIKDFYLRMRKSGGTESGIRAVPISARQLEALVRLSEASARSRLDDRVTRKDAKKAIELLDYCLMQVGFDRETGKVDIDRIATGIAASQRSHIMVLKDVINDLEAKHGKDIPIEEIIAEAKNRGLDEDKVEEALERLKRSGDVYEPRRGRIGKL